MKTAGGGYGLQNQNNIRGRRKPASRFFVPGCLCAGGSACTAQIHYQSAGIYITGFGTKKDDIGLVAEVNKKAVGAVWVRIMNDYGHIDNATPSIAVSLYKDYRGLGIGTALMKEMLRILKDRGYKQASLSVQKANYAVNMYQKTGFEIVDEKDSVTDMQKLARDKWQKKQAETKISD